MLQDFIELYKAKPKILLKFTCYFIVFFAAGTVGVLNSSSEATTSASKEMIQYGHAVFVLIAIFAAVMLSIHQCIWDEEFNQKKLRKQADDQSVSSLIPESEAEKS